MPSMKRTKAERQRYRAGIQPVSQRVSSASGQVMRCRLGVVHKLVALLHFFHHSVALERREVIHEQDTF